MRQRREYHLRRRYRITHADYIQMLRRQRGRCAICGSDSPGTGRNAKQFCVDHDHATGKVRALLCHRCNRALGLLNDDLGTVLEAAQYLVQHHAGVT